MLVPSTMAAPVGPETAFPPELRTTVRGRDGFKRGLDLGVTCLLLVVAAPVVAVAWVLVRLTSSGPGFYSQTRVGRFGEPFLILKLRTMYHRCEAKSGAAWATKNDPRVTPLGRILRKLHIDELPQLLNILRGDMSLVGPRPERPEFVGPLSKAIPGYADRLRVRPGLTGLAQIQLPPDSDLDSVRRKIVLDRVYLERRGLGLDLRLLAGTAVYLCGVSYGGVRRTLRLPNPLAGLADSLADTVVESSVPN
jgi:lipopolysaccharide/colanic/teichoic acid biosynthesis glycosyltransferase